MQNIWKLENNSIIYARKKEKFCPSFRVVRKKIQNAEKEEKIKNEFLRLQLKQFTLWEIDETFDIPENLESKYREFLKENQILESKDFDKKSSDKFFTKRVETNLLLKWKKWFIQINISQKDENIKFETNSMINGVKILFTNEDWCFGQVKKANFILWNTHYDVIMQNESIISFHKIVSEIIENSYFEGLY